MVDCAGSVQCILVVSTLASRSLLDPNKAAGLGVHAPFLPGRWRKKGIKVKETIEGVGMKSAEMEPKHHDCPLAAGCRIDHKSRLFYVSQWDMDKT